MQKKALGGKNGIINKINSNMKKKSSVIRGNQNNKIRQTCEPNKFQI